MSEWIDFERWEECRQLQRPGIAFEVENGDGQRMTTDCVVPLQTPWDWKSTPLRFRVVEVEPPRHSTPIPAPN